MHHQGVDADAFSHEAGFDAWMTGASFARFLKLHEVAAAPQVSTIEPLSTGVDAPEEVVAADSEAGAGGGTGAAVEAVADEVVVEAEVLQAHAPPLSAVSEFSGRLSLSW